MSSSSDTLQQLLLNRSLDDMSIKVIKAGLDGTELIASDVTPSAATPANRLSGQLLAELVSGNYGSLHFRGLRLKGFYIEGDIDLSFLEWNGQLALRYC